MAAAAAAVWYPKAACKHVGAVAVRHLITIIIRVMMIFVSPLHIQTTHSFPDNRAETIISYIKKIAKKRTSLRVR